MPITKAQRARRRKRLGSSDIAAIFGLNRYATAYDIWLEKTGQLVEEDEGGGKAWLDLGNDFEPIILDRASRLLGPLKSNVELEAPGGLPIGSNVDAIVIDTGEPVEAKMCGVFWPVDEEWGEPGTDQVPDRVNIQSHVHMICTDKPVCHVPVLLRGLRQELYRVERDPDIEDMIKKQAVTFWEEYVLKKCPPPDSLPSIDVVMQRKREAGKKVTIPQDVAERYMIARDLASGAAEYADACKRLFLMHMADARIGSFLHEDVPMEMRISTIQRKGYTVEPCTYEQAKVFKAK